MMGEEEMEHDVPCSLGLHTFSTTLDNGQTLVNFQERNSLSRFKDFKGGGGGGKMNN